MAEFGTALAITLGFEGGYCNDPKDPGGETNHGITMRTFLAAAHPLLGIAPTSENLRNLTQAQAGIIYRAQYWAPVLGDHIPHQELANILFDFYVNGGTHATSLLQQVMNVVGTRPALVVDGVLGRNTIRALEALPQDQVYLQYKQGRIAYYEALGARFPHFLKGWLYRVNTFPDLQVAPVTEAIHEAPLATTASSAK